MPDSTEETKRCPHCDEVVHAKALECKHCGAMLEEPVESPLPPQSGPGPLDDAATVMPVGMKRVLGGRYELLEELGRGGMGIVHKARDTKLNMLVAVKLLSEQLAGDMRGIQLLKREAITSMKLAHPNIVKLYHFEDIPEGKFLVMEFIDGKALDRILDETPNHKLSEQQLIRYAAAICKGLHYAHKQGVVHRDIKPSNIMVSKEGEIKVADFGIARVLKDSHTRHTSEVTSGTLLYMSPEQIQGDRTDRRSDIYSLGITFYELLKGEVPFSSGDITYQHLSKTPAPIQGISERLNAIVLKCLEKKPKDRFQNVRELGKALLGKSEIKPTRPTPRTEPQERRAVNSRLTTGIVAGLIVLFAITAGVVMISRTSGRKGPASAAEQSQRTEKLLSTGEAPEGMVLIPAGEFMMGTAIGGVDDEHPQHGVYLDAYFIDKYEVTNARFMEFANATGYVTDAEKQGVGRVWIADGWKNLDGANWRHPQGPNSSIDRIMDHPVVQVSWHDAVAYAKWAGKRLPTEAEWEKAARGTDGRKYPWGNTDPDGSKCNFADKNFPFHWGDKNADDGYERTSPAGGFNSGRSPYGLYDMAGNVFEWCSDWYAADYYSKSPSRNPENKVKGDIRMFRGASWANEWKNSPFMMRSAKRSGYPPNHRYSWLGFRCVRDVNVGVESHDVAKDVPPQKVSALQEEPRRKSEPTSPTSIKATKKAPEGMVLIPAGEFMMGTAVGGRYDEHPQHKVYLDAFFIDKYEVTNAKFKKFVEATGYVTDAENQGWGSLWNSNDLAWKAVDGADWRHPQGSNTSTEGIMNHPVVQASWNDATAYANWAGKRLPTEAEWEKAARGGLTGKTYVWGNDVPLRQKLGNFPDEALRRKYSVRTIMDGYDDNYSETSPLGSFPPNGYGLYDMAGNVWEWCSDWYGNYYRSILTENPKGPPNGDGRVLRGGSWGYFAYTLRVAYRVEAGPDYRQCNVGFRCAQDP